MGDRRLPRAEDGLAPDRPLSAPPDARTCPTCASIRDRTAPGGCIHETPHWFVDHCIGPLGVGTLIVKPRRHVIHVAALNREESAELGTVLREAAAVVTRLESPEQVYVTLWSHNQGVPGHIHFVVQPVTAATMAEHGDRYGPRLQVEMFDRAVFPDGDEAAKRATLAREAWAAVAQPRVA